MAQNQERAGKACLRARSAIFAPFKKLGMIIVDEEHEIGYQEKKHPKINSKQAAIIRAQTYAIPIIFGSATPSLNSLYNVQKKSWSFFQLKQRIAELEAEPAPLALVLVEELGSGRIQGDQRLVARLVAGLLDSKSTFITSFIVRFRLGANPPSSPTDVESPLDFKIAL
jgi:primosomal protein N'